MARSWPGVVMTFGLISSTSPSGFSRMVVGIELMPSALRKASPSSYSDGRVMPCSFR